MAIKPAQPHSEGNSRPELIVLALVLGAAALSVASRPEPDANGATAAAQKSKAPRSQQPALEKLGGSILDVVATQESAKDATCWTTVRMIEGFSIGLQLGKAAEIARIDASRELLRHLWRRASEAAPGAVLGEKHISAVLPAEAQKELPGLQVSDQAPIPVDKLGLRDHHKTTDNLRTLLSLVLEQMAQPGTRPYATFDSEGAQMLARASTAMTGLLLRESARFARQRNHERVELEDVQSGYEQLVTRWFPGSQKNKAEALAAREPRPAAMNAETFAGLRRLTDKAVLGKLRALRTYNKLGSPESYEDLNLLAEYLGKVAQFPVLPDGALALMEEVQQFAELFLSADGPFRSDAFADSLRGLAVDKRDSDRNDKPRLVRVSDVFNAAQNLFPTNKLANGDSEVYLVRQVAPHENAQAKFEERRVQLFGPSMDSIRDTGLHWLVLQRALKNSPRVALDPFAAELLTEDLAEYAFYLLSTAVDFAKENKKPAVVKQALQFLPWKYPKARFLPDPNVKQEASATLDPKLREGVRARYAGPLFRERSTPAKWSSSCTATRSGFQGFMSSGFAVGDFDRDGLIDLFAAADGCNRLLKNNGNYQFSDVTDKLGLSGLHETSRHPIFVDYDGDGSQDLLVVQSDQPSRLFVQRAGRFVDVSSEVGLSTRVGAHCAHFFDYDRDSDLDLFVGYYGPSQGNTAIPTLGGRNGYPNQLLRNDGAKFTDVSAQAGVASSAWTLASAAVDYDQDGWMDFWLANDWGRDELFHNRGDGTFEEVAQKYNVDDRGSGMNASIIDVNHDGRPDAFVSMIEMFSKTLRFVLPHEEVSFDVDDRILKSSYYIAGNKLFVGKEGGGFTDETAARVDPRDKGWAWGAAFFDLENDGDQDMYLANGWIANSAFAKQRNQLLINEDDKLIAFSPDINEEVPDESRFPESYLGSSRAVAGVDLSNSGKADLVVLDYEHGLRVFQNTTPQRGGHVRVKLVGAGKNKSGIGAAVRVFTADLPPMWRMVNAGADYLTQSALPIVVGTGKSPVLRVVVRWPSGRQTELQGPFADRSTIEVREQQ